MWMPMRTRELLTGGPLVARQGQLHLECCCHTGAERREDRKEGVALGPLLDAVVGQEAGADEPVVVFEDLGVEVVAEAAQERRRSLDIGEQERQRLDVESVGDERRGASAGSVHLLSAREGTIGSHPTVPGCRYEANANRLPHRIPTGLDGRTRRSRRLGVPSIGHDMTVTWQHDVELSSSLGSKMSHLPTDRAEKVGQRLNQDAWDQVRQLIKRPTASYSRNCEFGTQEVDGFYGRSTSPPRSPIPSRPVGPKCSLTASFCVPIARRRRSGMLRASRCVRRPARLPR